MTKYLLFLMTLVFVFYGMANADFYTWEDETGATHIADYPPPKAGPAQKVEVHKDTTASPNDEEQVTSSKDTKSKSKKPEVTFYTKNDCSDCDKAREFLKSKNISFTEYNMDTDKTAAVKRKDIDGSEDVPFAIINRNQVYGFSESVYNRALQLAP
ncbi:MAG TPA: glutaredoxin family protein [Smithellaceae bacterium]